MNPQISDSGFRRWFEQTVCTGPNGEPATAEQLDANMRAALVDISVSLGSIVALASSNPAMVKRHIMEAFDGGYASGLLMRVGSINPNGTVQ